MQAVVSFRLRTIYRPRNPGFSRFANPGHLPPFINIEHVESEPRSQPTHPESNAFRALRTAIRPAQRAVAAARRAASPAPRIRPASTSSNAKRNLKTALEPFPTPKNPSNTPHCDTPHVVKIAKKSSSSQPHVEADTGSNAVSQPPRHPASGIYRRSRRPTHAVAPNPHGRSYPISRFSIISIAPPVAAALTCGTRGAAVWECGKPPADKYVFHPSPQLTAWCHHDIQQKKE